MDNRRTRLFQGFGLHVKMLETGRARTLLEDELEQMRSRLLQELGFQEKTHRIRGWDQPRICAVESALLTGGSIWCDPPATQDFAGLPRLLDPL